MPYYLRLASWCLAALRADALRVGSSAGLSASGVFADGLLGEAGELAEALDVADAPLTGSLDATTRPAVKDEDIDAWLHMSHGDAKYLFMYQPILRTMQEGLQRLGAATRIVIKLADKAMVKGVRLATAKGRRPLVMTVALQWADNSTYEAIEECRRAGAYLVLYSPEPNDVPRVSALAERIGAREVWELSLHNALRYTSDFQQRVTVRFLPSGYSRKLDVGVGLDDPNRDEGKVGFLGRWSGRPQSVQNLYAGMFGSSFVSTYGSWNLANLDSFVRRYPLQLNVHQVESCCPRDPTAHVVMEAFRMTLLLSNKACVVSTPVPDDEMPPWEGLVHFAEANETSAVIERLRKDVRGCQEHSARLYKERFDPVRLIKNSGFLSVWQPRNVTAMRAALESFEAS
eukprot:CAMPEP_0204563896 /NCGR_PEP_ID=MMETSP0661-20131031/34575_1 /ASSEMBLY_ACC=CAM_ASM_000606 /TAXON_ID=109239 /ORGANISM="Alexandrium margalefi, Strain AMGDE01CS-322" /LENGTH=400 /DNA_ID=CAMNT_0051571493 /DNA_START=3 /DNA_END=1205 /DNA_ORIENTATION=-